MAEIVERYWHRKNKQLAGEPLTYYRPRVAIRKFCVDCMGGQYSLVEGCTDKACHLYPFRTGRVDRTLEIEGMEKIVKDKSMHGDADSASETHANAPEGVQTPPDEKEALYDAES